MYYRVPKVLDSIDFVTGTRRVISLYSMCYLEDCLHSQKQLFDNNFAIALANLSFHATSIRHGLSRSTFVFHCSHNSLASGCVNDDILRQFNQRECVDTVLSVFTGDGRSKHHGIVHTSSDSCSDYDYIVAVFDLRQRLVNFFGGPPEKPITRWCHHVVYILTSLGLMNYTDIENQIDSGGSFIVKDYEKKSNVWVCSTGSYVRTTVGNYDLVACLKILDVCYSATSSSALDPGSERGFIISMYQTHVGRCSKDILHKTIPLHDLDWGKHINIDMIMI